MRLKTKESKIEFLSYIIIVLLIANISGTFYLIFQNSTSKTSLITQNDKTELPIDLQSPSQKRKLFEDMKIAYNNNNYDALYNMLDALIQNQITKSSIIETTTMLKGIVGNIEKGVYSHFEVIKNNQGMYQFRLFYRLTVTKGEATLFITIGQQGNEKYRIFGWNLNKNS